MPPPIQNLPIKPVQTILPPKSADRIPPRAEDFHTVLKEIAHKTATTKADAKRPTSKLKAAKPAKPKSTKPQNDQPDPIDESPEPTGSEGSPAADEAQSPIPADTAEAAAEAAQGDESSATDPNHPAQTATPTDLAAAAAGAQSVQPIDRTKDQKPCPQTPKHEDPDLEALATTPVPSAPTDQASTETEQPTTPFSGSPQVSTSATTGSPAPTAARETTPTERTATPSKKPTPTVSPLTADVEPEPKLKTPSPAVPKTASDTPADSTLAASQFADLAAPPATDGKSKTIDADPSLHLAPEPVAPRAHQPEIAKVAAPLPPPEVEFADANHDKIVTGVRTQILPHGGAMQIRLDPPELGALKVMVEMRDGVMNATFETSNENATQLLSHSLNQLKHVLEGQGVSVERLQVQQAPKGDTPTPKDQDQQQQRERQHGDDHAARQEQQRKEMLRRMWRRVSGASDPVDFLA